MNAATPTAFELLADYEQRSLTHVAGQPEQIATPGLWRGIGFRIGNRLFASSIDEISELLVMQPLTAVPTTQPWLLGIANVRGNLVPVVDMGRFLFDERVHPGERTRLLVVGQRGGSVGLLVDEIIGQRTLGDEQRDVAEGEDDERVSRFVSENVMLDDQRIGLFSMSRLARAPDFLQAAL